MSAKAAEIQHDDLAKMEAVLQAGLEICYRLRKKAGKVSTRPTPRKGLNQKQTADLLINRRKRIGI